MKLSTKSTVEKYLLLLWMLQNVPPILISAGAGRRANPKVMCTDHFLTL